MLLAGFVVLMMLMVTVIYNDLTRISWIERLMPLEVAAPIRVGLVTLAAVRRRRAVDHS